MKTSTAKPMRRRASGIYVMDDIDREIQARMALSPRNLNEVRHVRAMLDAGRQKYMPKSGKKPITYDGYTIRELKKAIDVARKYQLKGAAGYVECVVAMRASSALFNTYTTAKTVIDSSGLWDMPRNYMYEGRKFRLRAAGALSNIVTTPGTITFQLMIGAVIAWTSGAVQLNATAHTTLPFFIDLGLTCQQFNTGTTGTAIMGIGTIEGLMVTRTAGQTDDAQGMQTIVIPQTNPALGTGFDGHVVNTVDWWAGFSISNAGNGVRFDEYSIEMLT